MLFDFQFSVKTKLVTDKKAKKLIRRLIIAIIVSVTAYLWPTSNGYAPASMENPGNKDSGVIVVSAC